MSFLEALRPHVDLGPLDHLRQLDLTNNASNIWPTLKPEKDVQRKFVGHECILQHYTAIEVNHNFDIEWIKKHMNASAWVHWETVESMVHSNRRLETKRIIFEGFYAPYPDVEDEEEAISITTSLQELAAKGGGEFVRPTFIREMFCR
ncbi:unnamed protein product [Aphanomyces euteiches]